MIYFAGIILIFTVLVSLFFILLAARCFTSNDRTQCGQCLEEIPWLACLRWFNLAPPAASALPEPLLLTKPALPATSTSSTLKPTLPAPNSLPAAPAVAPAFDKSYFIQVVSPNFTGPINQVSLHVGLVNRNVDVNDIALV